MTYNKWIRTQVEEWLGLPELYCLLPGVISVKNIEGRDLIDKTNDLQNLLDCWVIVE